MRLENVITGVGRPWSSEFGHGPGGRDQVNSELCLEAVIEGGWRCTWNLWSREYGDALIGYNWAWFKEYLEVVDLEAVDGRHTGCWDSIHWVMCQCGNVKSWVQHHPPRDERLAGSRRQSNLGWCSTWLILHLVLTLYHGMERLRGMTYLRVRRVDIKKERDDRRWGKSSCKTGTWENLVCEWMCDRRDGRYEARSSG